MDCSTFSTSSFVTPYSVLPARCGAQEPHRALFCCTSVRSHTPHVTCTRHRQPRRHGFAFTTDARAGVTSCGGVDKEPLHPADYHAGALTCLLQQRHSHGAGESDDSLEQRVGRAGVMAGITLRDRTIFVLLRLLLVRCG